MKNLKAFWMLVLCAALLVNLSSCVVLVNKKDNGKHKGWYKKPGSPGNSKNPGAPHPGKPKGNSGKK
ncbi:MAG TPA: hypothetical protein VI731_12240 [Bacteroidia bacterium]|nr:hypothetical protein [Bacteroidia bacterium]